MAEPEPLSGNGGGRIAEAAPLVEALAAPGAAARLSLGLFITLAPGARTLGAGAARMA